MGGATEATLAELLSVAEAMNINISRLVSNLGGGGGNVGGPAGAAARNVSRLGQSAEEASSSLKKLASGILNVLGDIIGKTIDGLRDTVKGLYNFSLAAANGTARLSDFYRALERLPFFIGTIAGVVADFIKYAEGLLDTYRDLTKSGSSFSGNIFEMARQASISYLSLSEFSNIVKRGSEIFASMSGNVQRGINRFVELQNQMMGPNSRYGRALLGMGFSFEEVGETIVDYMRVQGNLSRSQITNTDLVLKGAFDLAREMDLLSKITGKRKEQLEAEVKELQEEEMFQQFLAGLDDTQKQMATVGLKIAGLGGKDYARDFRMAIMTGLTTPLTDGSRGLEIFSQGLRTTSLETAISAFRNSKSLREFSDIFTRSMHGASIGTGNYLKNLGPLPAILSQQGNAMMQSSFAFSRLGRTLPDVSKAIAEASKNQTTQQNGNAKSLAMAEVQVRQFGQNVFNLFNQFFAPLIDPLGKFGRGLLNALSAFLKSETLQKVMQNVINWFTVTFTELSKVRSIEDFFNVVKRQFGSLYDGLVFFFKDTWLSMKPDILVMFERIGDWLYDAIYSKIYGKTSKQEEEEKLRSAIKYNQEQIEFQRKELNKKGLPQAAIDAINNNITTYQKNLINAQKAYDNFKLENEKKYDNLRKKYQEESNIDRQKLKNENQRKFEDWGARPVTPTVAVPNAKVSLAPAPVTTNAAVQADVNLASAPIQNNSGFDTETLNNAILRNNHLLSQSIDVQRRMLTAVNNLSQNGFNAS